MSFISVKHINKTFKVKEKSEGRFSTLKTFFNRKYKYINAIKDISFSIKKGEIVGYIGPNGAGKSTTIKILSGILVPDSGEVVIDKMIPWKARKNYVSKIGVVFGQRSQLWWDIPAIDSFNLLKDIYKISDKVYVYISNGEIVELPKGATIIDLAYKLGDNIGNTLIGARINNEYIYDLGYELKNKDRVIVLTDELSYGSREEWIDKAKTSYAKKKIMEFKIDI